MKTNIKLLISTLVLIFFFLTSCSRFNVIHITENQLPSNKDGVFYALPRNYVTIDITIKETENIKGPYAKYASKYLGLKNVQIANSKFYEIADIKISTYSRPDPEQFYFVELGNKQNNKNKGIMLQLSEAGLIQNVNDKSEILLAKTSKDTKHLEEIDYSKTFKYFADANLYERIDTIIEEVTLDTITFEKKILKKTLVEKSLEQRAKDAADFIMRIKENRFNIITGYQEVAYEKGSVEYMYSELEKLENEYMKLFTGLSVTKTYKYRYTYLPEENVFSASFPLFKFSKSNGVVKADYPSGEMVYIHIDRERNTKDVEKFLKEDHHPKQKNHGFYYRIPEYAKFSIKQGIVLKAEASFIISQFGIVTYLPAKKTKLQFFPNSGAIKNVGVE